VSEFRPSQSKEDVEALEEMDKPIKTGDTKAFKAARRLKVKRAARKPGAELSQDQLLKEAGKLGIMRPGDVREAERKLRFATGEQKEKLLQQIRDAVSQAKARKSVGE
jgi:hypothetical protein